MSSQPIWRFAGVLFMLLCCALGRAETEGFQLNFIDTDIATVVSSVIGDGLGLPYSVDPQVKGTMSLQAARPLKRDEVLPALEAALRLQGAAMIPANGGYAVVPSKEAARQVTGLRSAGDHHPGFGIQIVPLQYVSVADMERILKPFAPDGAIVRVDENRNMLLLAGSSQELATLIGVVHTFDVDWLAGMSFSVYKLEYAEPHAVADDLAQIFADSKSPVAGLVRFVPLARLNSLLVVAQQQQYLRKVEGWIKQLDVVTTTGGRRVYIYEVQNGKATDLAGSLSGILSLPFESRNSANPGNAGTHDRASAPQIERAQPVGAAGGMRVVPNDESNALLIYATRDEFALIENALKQLDVEPIQVLIEASLAEVKLTDELRFGLQWAYQSHSGPVTLSNNSSGAIAQQFPGFSYLYTGRPDIQAVLNTLESLTTVNVLSSPKLLVLNNHEAQLQVGDQVPVVTQSALSPVGGNAPIINTVQMLDTGVILRITPRVNKNGLVLLDIAQEVSDVVPTTTSNIDSPTIQQRKVSSSVAVHDGETLALGGLIRDSRSKSRDGLPFLRRIPLLGTLFGSTDNNRTRTELIVLLTPRVIRSGTEAAAVMDELQNEFRKLHETLPNWRDVTRSNAH